MIRNSKLNKLIRSVVALFLILTLLATATYAWLSNAASTKIDTSDFITISADTGLNMNYGYGDNNQGTMKIPQDCVLAECSSSNGKNFFFPLSAYGENGDKDFSNDTHTRNEFIYREGTELDKNKKYISLDLELSAENDTDVWLSRDSFIRNADGKKDQTSANAVRISFIENKIDGEYTLFDNLPDKKYSEQIFNELSADPLSPHFPIGSINRDGTGPVKVVDASHRPHALSEYYPGNTDENVLFKLEAGVPLHITVNIWLEGTDPECKFSVLDVKDLNIFIKFTTTYEAQNLYYFKDYTLEKWVEDEDCYVFAQDVDTGELFAFNMSANYDNDYTWSGEIPESVTNVRFVRYNPKLTDEGATEEWNYWDAGELGECKTYNAFGHSAGMWAETFTPTTITLFDSTPNGFIYNNHYENEEAMFYLIAHVEFEVEDSNGNLIYQNYKLSYHHNRNQWQINIPSQVTDINFNVYQTVDYNDPTPEDITNPIKQWTTTRSDEIYYSMVTYEDEDLGVTSTGYWSNELIYVDGQSFTDEDAFIALRFYDTESGFEQWAGAHAKTDNGRYKAAVPPELMQDNTATVYFSNSKGWSTPKLYYWNSSTASPSFPGLDMTYSHKNEYNEDVYKVEVPIDATSIIISDNGSDSKRTNNITDINLYDGIGFYPINNTVSSVDDKNYGTYDLSTAAVIVTRYDRYADVWDWEYVYNQTTDDLVKYQGNNKFTIEDYNDDVYINDAKALKGTWSKDKNP